jgi:hypothetical protein
MSMSTSFGLRQRRCQNILILAATSLQSYRIKLCHDIRLVRVICSASDDQSPRRGYKKFFKTLKEEKLLGGAPVITKGKYGHAFRR